MTLSAHQDKTRISYAHGSSTTPLLGQTIGASFDEAVAAHGEREALVVCHQAVRWTYAELGERVERSGRLGSACGGSDGDLVA